MPRWVTSLANFLKGKLKTQHQPTKQQINTDITKYIKALGSFRYCYSCVTDCL